MSHQRRSSHSDGRHHFEAQIWCNASRVGWKASLNAPVLQFGDQDRVSFLYWKPRATRTQQVFAARAFCQAPRALLLTPRSLGLPNRVCSWNPLNCDLFGGLDGPCWVTLTDGGFRRIPVQVSKAFFVLRVGLSSSGFSVLWFS